MRWSVYDLVWGRPLKSITALFNNKVINFNFFHIKSNNTITIDDADKDRIKKISGFKSYSKILKSQGIILDQEKRKNIILKKMNSLTSWKTFNDYL